MKKILSLFAAVLFAGTMFGQAYKLVKVTSVQNNKMYVIEQKDKGRVLIGYNQDNAIKSTDSYVTEGLLGDEQYVWKTVEATAGEFALCNMERYADDPAGHVYISNANNDTKLVMGNTGSNFRFTFTGNVALIDNPGNSNRFIGETSDGSGLFKAYGSGNLSSYNHDFYVYELQEITTPYVYAKQKEIDFGTVEKGATVESKTVEVIFGNLTGAVTYSLSTVTPFAASGTIAASGDKITIAASAASVEEYSAKLTVTSAADGKSDVVTLKMKVVEGADPSAKYGLYKEALVEGDYVIYYNGKAMNTSLTGTNNDRLGYAEVTPVDNVITGPDAAIIWHIAKSGDYWTLYNLKADAYAATKGSKNTAIMLADGTDDKALWKLMVSDGAFDFENKYRAAASSNPDNKWLRNNGTNGFACYTSGTGGALSLYKKGYTPVPTAIENTMVEATAVKVIENGQLIIIKDGVRYNVAGQIVR